MFGLVSTTVSIAESGIPSRHGTLLDGGTLASVIASSSTATSVKPSWVRGLVICPVNDIILAKPTLIIRYVLRLLYGCLINIYFLVGIREKDFKILMFV